MPGDAVNSSIGFLDVQFGGLDLCSETFDASSTGSEPQAALQASLQASPQPSQKQSKLSDSSAPSNAAQASLDVSAQSTLSKGLSVSNIHRYCAWGWPAEPTS